MTQKIIFPVSSNSVSFTDTYGAKRGGNRKHEGIDIFAPVLSPIVSVTDGIILKVGRDVLGGNIIEILGKDKRIYYYAHLAKILVSETKNSLRQGEIIGLLGNTGNAVSTPPHLHFEIMEVDWLLPLIIRNINPYEELTYISYTNK